MRSDRYVSTWEDHDSTVIRGEDGGILGSVKVGDGFRGREDGRESLLTVLLIQGGRGRVLLEGQWGLIQWVPASELYNGYLSIERNRI